MDFATLLLLALKISILLMVFAIGLHASWQNALYLLRQPALLARSFLAMNVVMPIVALGIVMAFDLPATMKIALLALAISPVPPILPRKEMKAGGDESFAVALLVTLGALAIVTVPLSAAWLAEVFGRNDSIAPLAVAKIVLASVLAPLAAGIVLRHWRPALARKIAIPIAATGNVLLLATALPLAASSWPAIWELIGEGALLAAAAMAAIALLVGHLLGGPEKHHRRVLALSTSLRHPAIALSAAVGAGAQAKPVLAAILLYFVVATLVAIPYIAWRRRSEKAAAVFEQTPGEAVP